MAFSSITRALQRSALTGELLTKLDQQGKLVLNGVARLPKGLVSSALAQAQQRPLLVITATLEEAGRWATQLEAMGWDTVHFYPTSEASPYDPFDQESEMTWGQLQVLADLLALRAAGEDSPLRKLAIVATERALQPHLPPVSALEPYCLRLELKQEINFKELGQRLATLGYDRVTVVETEGQWAQRGDIIDVYPVASELPVRLELFGDELERLREFDPATQRSLDAIDHLVLTPTQYGPVIIEQLREQGQLDSLLSEAAREGLESGILPEGTRRWLGLAFSQPASLLDYLPENSLMAVDEVDQCQAHSDRWLEHVEDHRQEVNSASPAEGESAVQLPKIHRSFLEALGDADVFPRIDLSEIAEANNGLNLASRPVQAIPHQFGKLAETIRSETKRKYAVWLASAQPSRSVALLQEHDCPAQFIPNPRDFNAIDKLHTQHVPVAVKYSGLAELEGFVLPTFRIVVVTDREFFGQHTLATGGYVRKRRRAASKQVDPNKMKPGDFVVHRSHGIGKFIKLESLVLNHETRDYLVIQYADGIL
ncbi:MAG: CarD family transcriptional regulator, partial [Nodosilinea sp.]